MVCLYKNIVFYYKSSGKLFRGNYTFLEITDNGLKYVKDKYKKDYPNDSFRESGKGQGIPSYITGSAIRELENDENYLNEVKRLNREESLKNLID